MPNSRFPQSRAERLIAFGRFALAVASFGAVYLDPLSPSRFATLTYTLLGAYSVYALALMAWAMAAATSTRRTLVITHVVDVLLFGTINYTTFGPTSPFFVFFVFSIICAMLRFGRRGTILTAALAMVVFIASSVTRVAPGTFELNRFIIRVAYLFVLASMLIYLAAYHDRIQRDLQRIARWPRSVRGDQNTLVSQLMTEAASIFNAGRVILAYQHLSARAVYLCDATGDQHAVEQPSEVADLLLERDIGTYFSSASFAAIRLDADESINASRRRNDPDTTHGLPRELEQRFGVDRVVSTPFKGEFVRGRLLLLDGPPPLLEEVNLARIAGAVVAGRLDHFHAAQQLQRGAVAEERVRVARDLHDSVLQSLTGVALQLRTLPRLMLRDREAAESRLGEIEQVITAAQKELRWFIDALRPDRPARDAEGLGERLASLAQRFRDQWGLEVGNDVADVVHLLPLTLRREIYAIVNEAVANAAKHAGAKRVEVSVDIDDRAVRIDVADDGRGFPFQGTYDLPALLARQIGPMSLKERVSALGGSMVINSSNAGAKLEIRMPLAAAGVGA